MVSFGDANFVILAVAMMAFEIILSRVTMSAENDDSVSVSKSSAAANNARLFDRSSAREAKALGKLALGSVWFAV